MGDTLRDLKKVNVSVTLTPEQLEALTDAAAEKARRAVEEEYKKQQQEIYYTKARVLKILGVTAPTLWKWDKNGVLKAVRIGGLIRYKKSDIDRITATN